MRHRPVRTICAVVAAVAVSVPSQGTPAAKGEQLLIDSAAKNALDWPRPSDAETEELLRRFPDPHAKPGARCALDDPAALASTRAGGYLQPSITTLGGAFTQAGATQTAYLIPYCETGFGARNTVRLLVLDKDQVVLDRDLTGTADRLVLARDVDGDGRAELLVSRTIYETSRNVVRVRLLRLTKGAPISLGSWVAMRHCSPSVDDNQSRGLRIYFHQDARGVSFRDEPVVEKCYYPPAPPPPPAR